MDLGRGVPPRVGTTLEVMFAAVEQAFRVVYVEPKLDDDTLDAINKKLEQAGKDRRIRADGVITDAAGNVVLPKKKAKAS
jgi:hypothetical protein